MRPVAALIFAPLAALAAYLLGDSYTDRMSDPRGFHLVAVDDQVRAPAPERPARTVVVVADGLRRDAALGMAATRRLAAAGQCRTTDVGAPSISRPVYTVLSTGVEQDRSGIRHNGEERPATVESIWEVARRAGLRVEGRSELTWWRETFPNAFDQMTILARSAAYLSPPPTAGLTLVHPVWIDETGHDHGADSRAYAEGVDRLDRELGGFLDGVDLTRDLVVLTADHGHTARGGHGGRAPEVALVLTCLAGRGVAHLADAPPMFSRDLAPALAVLLGLPFPRHMRAGDDDLDVLWQIVDPAAFPAAYLADRREAVERFRAANPSWSAVYAEGRARQQHRLALLAGLVAVLLGAAGWRADRLRGVAWLMLWSAAAVTVAVIAHLVFLGSFDFTAINRRGDYLRNGSEIWAAVAAMALVGRLVRTRDARRTLLDLAALLAAALLVDVGLVWVFGWPLGFPLAPPLFFFLPFFTTIGTVWLAAALLVLALVVALSGRASRRVS